MSAETLRSQILHEVEQSPLESCYDISRLCWRVKERYMDAQDIDVIDLDKIDDNLRHYEILIEENPDLR